MADSTNTPPSNTPPPNGPRRPLLAGGEKLRQQAIKVRGPGDKAHPYGVEQAWEILGPQAEKLSAELAQIPTTRCAHHVVFEATLLPNYLASSYFPTSLLDKAQLYPVGTRQTVGHYKTAKLDKPNTPTKTLLLAGEKHDVAAFAQMIKDGPLLQEEALWEQIREFSSITFPNPKQVVKSLPKEYGAGELITWEAVISVIGRTPSEQRYLNDDAFSKWVEYINSLNGEVDVNYRRSVGGVTFVPIALNVEAIYQAAAFNPLRALRPMPTIRPVPVSIARSVAPLFQPPPPDRDAKPLSDLRVAVFDGGIDVKNPYLSPFTTLHDVTPQSADPDYVDHGSLVTTGLLHGHVEGIGALPPPPCYVDHYRVLPMPPSHRFEDNLYWVLDRVIENVKKNNHKLVNLSIGPSQSIEDDGDPHRWTAELDTLAEEHGVTIVTAVGNNGEDDKELGFNRIQVPSNMVNGIGVGSCTSQDRTLPLKRASYSAIGPGSAGQRLQPVGVCFGGSPSEQFRGFNRAGRLAYCLGTSFAAPTAMHGLSGLSAGLGPDRSHPASLRAFAVHFAEDRRKRGHKELELGAGRLRDDYSAIWNCLPNEVTVLYQDTIRRGDVAAMTFPFPEGLVPDTELSLKWTLCFTSKVNPADSADYTLSGFNLTLRPHARRFSVNDVKTKKKLTEIDVGVQDDQQKYSKLAAARAVKLSENPVACEKKWRRRGRHEADLREAGKWETICRGQISVEAKELFQPRIDLQYLARTDGVLSSDTTPIGVTLLVTITAPDNVALYDLVRQKFNVLVPLVQHVTSAVPGVA